MKANIKHIAIHLPEKVLSNNALQAEFPDLKLQNLTRLTGVYQRHISDPKETSADLAFHAAEKLFAENDVDRNTIDFVLYCTQIGDYYTPSTSCILQERLGIPSNAGSLDFNQGCTGYVYGLSIAKGMVETGMAKNILFLTSSNITKLIHEEDKSNRAIFGDAATASLITGSESDGLGNFTFGTDGSGFDNIIIKYGGEKYPPKDYKGEDKTDGFGNVVNDAYFYMNGQAVFNFSLEKAPMLISQLLEKHQLQQEDIKLFILHQANRIILESIFMKMKIPKEKQYFALEKYGNTVASTIPIALHDALKEGKLQKGDKVVLAGFGVGLSWAGSVYTV